jgi:hypothetical protein
MPALPDFVIIGAQKAASTLVVECLRQHPQVYMPRGETHYFLDHEFFNQTTADLAAVFAGQERVLRRGIKCPDYLGQPDCAARIRATLGSPDILAVLRNPADRAVSAYFWRMRWGQLPVASAEIGLRRLLKGEYDSIPRAAEILEYGKYGKHLSRFEHTFGRQHMLVLLDRDMARDAHETIRRVYEFLRVDADVRPAALRRRQNEGVYPLQRIRLLRRRNRFVYDNGDPATGRLRRPRRLFPLAASSAVVLADRHLAARLYGNERPTISDELRRELEDYYRSDIQMLESSLSTDLAHWFTAR